MIGTTDQVFRKIEEATRALVTFNAAGIAGVISLIQKGTPTPFVFKVASIAFLLGVFAAVACWVFSMSGPLGVEEAPHGRDLETEFKRMVIALYVSIGAFLAGIVAALIGAG